MDERRVPIFARDFPSTLELDALVDAFARGDYARVRAEAPKLAAATSDDAVRSAARTLVERTKPDRLALGLLAATAILLVGMTAYWIANGHAPPGGGPPKPSVEHPRPPAPSSLAPTPAMPATATGTASGT
jgi:hypothetical protein